MIICYIPLVDKPIEDSSPSLDLPDFTLKQESFINAYIELRSGRKAALKAGYSAAGASTEASRLLSNPIIYGEVRRRLQSIGWSKEKVLYEVSEGYEECKRQENLKERREFVVLMAKLMGYLSTEGSGQNISIINISGNRLESYNQTYVKKAQVIDSKEVTSFVKRAITSATSDNNEATGDKL